MPTAENTVNRRGYFASSPSGQRLMVVTEPQGTPRGALLYLHPTFEEMNRSRRMIALSAQQFAQRGYLTCQIDLKGCGDSANGHGDATWQDWLDDIQFGWNHLTDAAKGQPVILWTLRSSSLLAANWMNNTGAVAPLLAWQPAANGQQILTQFLRLKAAAMMLGDGAGKDVMSELRQNLKSGQPVEVAGYRLHPELAQGLSNSRFDLPEAHEAPVRLLEVSTQDNAELSPQLAKMLGKLKDAGLDATASSVSGPHFWQTQEVETAPQLIDASLKHLDLLTS